jgi:trk system potassium uptake protein TrkH
MSSLLVLVGMLLFFLIEQDNTLAGQPFDEQLAAAFFQSVTARTAGFNTVDTGLLRPATLLFMIVLMFIGASPGSTGGGIKTTTFFLVIQSIRASLREQGEVVVLRRQIPHELVSKALAITGLFLFLIALASGGILLADPQFRFEQVLFETVSAAATVGLSTGITGELSPLSKSILIAVMFLGRIGPLTMLLALSLRRRTPPVVVFPEERLMVG